MELRERYKTAKTYVKTLISTSKTEYYQDRLRDSKGNTSATWKVLGEIIPNKKKKKHSTHNFLVTLRKLKSLIHSFPKWGNQLSEVLRKS